LERALLSNDPLFTDDDSAAFGPGEVFYNLITGEGPDRDGATDFWADAAEEIEITASFVAGFAAGAVALWRKIRHQI